MDRQNKAYIEHRKKRDEEQAEQAIKKACEVKENNV
jgi:hypothetical protein